jgi:pyruvate kinase
VQDSFRRRARAVRRTVVPRAAWKHTKIVCTLGPASDRAEVLAGLVEAGMDVARVNLSHGNFEEHGQRVRAVREAAHAAARPVAVLADLPGPKWRLGAIVGGARELRDGERVRFAAQANGARELPVPHPELLAALRAGARVYMADGAVKLRVDEKRGEGAEGVVLAGGIVRSGSGINVPELVLPALVPTEQDRRCIAFAVSQGVEWIGVSFVQEAADLERVRDCLPGTGAPLLMAKIEKRGALAELDAILDAADAALVARGDLGVETELAEVPLVQKRIIRAANAKARPVVTATQMLESMVERERPTRAEVSDVANAVLDGSDAVMLSAESAVGRHPVLAAQMLGRVIEATEAPSGGALRAEAGARASEAMSAAACELAGRIGACAIIARVQTVAQAAALARLRPRAPILALGDDPAICRALALVRGVLPLSSDAPDTAAGDWLYAKDLARPGEPVVLVSSSPDSGGESDTIRVIRLAG